MAAAMRISQDWVNFQIYTFFTQDSNCQIALKKGCTSSHSLPAGYESYYLATPLKKITTGIWYQNSFFFFNVRQFVWKTHTHTILIYML